jgi:hypothetical protein
MPVRRRNAAAGGGENPGDSGDDDEDERFSGGCNDVKQTRGFCALLQRMPNIEDCVAEAQSFRPLRRLPDCAKAPQKETQMSPREDWLFDANRAMCVTPGEETGRKVIAETTTRNCRGGERSAAAAPIQTRK